MGLIVSTEELLVASEEPEVLVVSTAEDMRTVELEVVELV